MQRSTIGKILFEDEFSIPVKYRDQISLKQIANLLPQEILKKVKVIPNDHDLPEQIVELSTFFNVKGYICNKGHKLLLIEDIRSKYCRICKSYVKD